MRALIVDDEPIARQILREHLAGMPGVEVAGEASDGEGAVEQIGVLHPDLVILDLQMPGLDGFAVARSLQGNRLPLVIFVTAYETHAIEAFNIGAVDYLLKPIRSERLATAIARAERQLQQTPAAEKKPEPLRKVAGRIGDEFHLLDPASVIAFVADHESVYILTASGKYLADQTLKAIEDRLPAPPFRRIHRRTIINTDHIRKLSPLSSKRWLLKMSNGLDVVVSKRMAGAMRQETEW